ncbi:MAG: hypothetical protein P0Y56_01190 [Candidatus Andeanibacterium colombiense]|uniref:Uncharacterized protein n=1 Tax=Candidatus Andeanibacterium colombiense TaxID=3121345 RepID=A0AAJ6BMY9_9SPHN|nr:MAG: hypothetical protein P0Y56_01190 [Sphingomonadaceae bacterium]
MKRVLAALICVGLVASVPVSAQTNDNDFTPTGSRIKRSRQFPLDLPERRFTEEQQTKVNRDRSKAMLGQFSKCLFHRSNEKSFALLDKTDFGFVDFKQIALDNDKAMKIYGFSDCLRRVADTNNSGVQLWFSASALRQWLLEQAYFDEAPDGPAWVKPGNVIAERQYPLSGNNSGVHAAMDLADCMVQTDPYDADYFFRTASGTDEEKAALKNMVPAIGECVPQGVQMQIDPRSMRVWVGEGLWHAAKHSAPADEAASGGAE